MKFDTDVCITDATLNADKPLKMPSSVFGYGRDRAAAMFRRWRKMLGELILLHIVPEIRESVLAYRFAGADDRPLSERVAKQRMETCPQVFLCRTRLQ